MILPVPAPPAAQVAAEYADLELLGKDVDVDRVVLDVIQKGVPSFNAVGSIIDAKVYDTMSGAPTFTLQLHDPELRLLQSSVIWTFDSKGNRRVRAVDVDVKGRPYRLVQVQWGAASTGAGVDLTLTFEHRLVAYLREHDRPRKVSRNKATLAEFISSFAREVKAMKIRFVCRELTIKQPIEKLSKDVAQPVRDSKHDPGLPTGADITVKGKKATRAQRKTLDNVLRAGESKNMPRRALVIAVMVVTQESVAGKLRSNTSNPGVRGSFHQDASYGTPAQRNDDFHAAGKFYDKLAKVLKAHPSGYSYGELADKVQISGDPAGYQQWKDEAEHTVKAFAGTGSESRTFIKAFNYTRGVDGKREDSWDCSQRYAQLVNWRSFVKGKATWVYESEPVLFKARPLARIARDEPAVVDIQGDCDTGKEVETLTVQVRVALWTTPPGSTVIVDGEGPGTDRWLIEDYDRSLFDPLGTLTLQRPAPPKAEPAPDTGSSSTDASTKSKSGKLYQACKHIGAIGCPYTWGGGHGPKLADVHPTKASGLDCSGSVSLALYRADLFKGDTAIVSGDFNHWGEPGQGRDFTVWYNADHVWIEFHNLGSGKRFDTSPHGDGANGPRVRNSARSSAGFSPRHWPGL